MSESSAISVQELRKTYRDGFFSGKRFEALKGVSLDVNRGEIFGLLGPNGAGKTTFVKIMLGIIRKTAGAATMLDEKAGAQSSRKRVGYLPEHLRVPRHMTGFSALHFYGKLSGLSKKQINERQYSVMETVGLAGREKERVSKYSKGMVQRLGLAQSLLHSPELLFLDEPTDGLDPVGRAEVRRIIFEMKEQGRTVFLNSHLLQEVEMICDRVAILDQGRLRYVGPPADITADKRDGFELELELVGNGDAAREAIGERTVVSSTVHDEGHYTIVVRIDNQDDVDVCIDALRQHQVSIHKLARRRITLEDAFLEILASPVNEA